ncbi:MAG: transposase [Hyphomonas sp.]
MIAKLREVEVRLARRGTRPIAPHDQRTKWACIFGAICPARGTCAGLVLPWCDTFAMNLHLAEISKAVAPGAHALIIMDQAGWHTTPKTRCARQHHPPAAPAKSPEPDPVENIWQCMRDNWLSNRVFTDYQPIVALCGEAWEKLAQRPWKIMSPGLRDRAHG